MKELKRSLISLYGLFLPYHTNWLAPEEREDSPVKMDGKWVFTLSIGHVPLGWIMLVVAWIV